jgi:hypothetical protein
VRRLEPNAFAASLTDEAGVRLRLAVSRELATVYTDVLLRTIF